MGGKSWRIVLCMVVSIFSVIGMDVSFNKVYASSDCDKARAVFSKGFYNTPMEKAVDYYLEAIELCPGYIRPYELTGNHFRKNGQKDKAIQYFLKAADLGTTNHKLYYLLADLLFQQGNQEAAAKYIQQALSLRDDYPKSQALYNKIMASQDTIGPQIILFEPEKQRAITIRKYKTMTIRGLVTDQSDLAWFKINGQAISVAQSGHFIKEVPVSIGENVYLIEASDKRGNATTLSIRVQGQKVDVASQDTVNSATDPKRLYRRSYAVVIGVNAYTKWPSLEFAVADAKAVEQLFKDIGFDEVTVITDHEATQRRILTELFQALPNKVKREDRVVFYFAGHGQTEDLPNGGKKGYIIPVDADTFDYTTTAISMNQIRNLSSRIAAKHILYVIDSCYSGLGLSRSYGLSPKLSGYLKKVASMRVVQIVTAGGKGEQVQERDGHGLFTSYFLKALKGAADIDKDKVVTGTELGAYLRPAVSNASGQTQTPLYGRLEGEGEVIFSVSE